MSIKPDLLSGFVPEFLVRAYAPIFPQGYATSVTVDTTNRLQKLGLEAARAAAIPVADLTVETKPDASGTPAHFFRYVINSTDPFDGRQRMRLLQELRDRLLKQVDEHYPFVEIAVR